MNLPFVLDIVIGLVLIYLVLSFLSSEIQELITTLLQWRAAHLKKSIEVLLSGDENDANKDATLAQSRELLGKIYDHVLIKNISQESRGGIEAWLRHMTRTIVTLGKKEGLTLKGNEPSYIPAETFATALLEKLGLAHIVRALTALKLQILIERDILPGIETGLMTYSSSEEAQLNRKVVEDLGKSLGNLKETFNEIHAAFASKDSRISLRTVVYRLKNELNNYILKTTQRIQKHLQETAATDRTSPQTLEDDPNDHPFLGQLVSLQRRIFYDDKSANYDNIDEVIRQLQPDLAEVLGVFKSEVSDEFKKYENQYEGFKEVYQTIRGQAQTIASELPPPVLESLTALSRRAEINLARSKDQVELLQDELQQFKLEIQNWFDRSMDRASGVYKRNAKGVGFLIGLVIAIAINADTFHIVTRLSTDSTLRDALVSSAEVISSQCNSPTERNSPTEQPTSRLPGNSFALPFEQPAFAQDAPDSSSSSPQSAEDCVTQAVERATTLPIGWNQEESTPKDTQADKSTVSVLSSLRKLLGWAVTGLAIAMGASFWFDLLGKVVNVRNAGKRPESKVDTDSSATSGNDR